VKISIIATEGFQDRLRKLLSSTGMLSHDFSIYCEEDPDYQHSYSKLNLKWLLDQWDSYLDLIRYGLIDNIRRAGASVPEWCDEVELEKLKNSFGWLNLRRLRSGDLSVMSKHRRALRSFVESNEQYVLVMEDDAQINSDSLRLCRDLAGVGGFSYIDVGGGDGISARHQDSYELLSGFSVERVWTCSSRTACAYIASKEAAESILHVLDIPVMPIDWSISVGLSPKRLKNSKVLWALTPPIIHGSCSGDVKSWRSEAL